MKKKIRLLLTILLAVIMLMSSIPLFTISASVDDIKKTQDAATNSLRRHEIGNGMNSDLYLFEDQNDVIVIGEKGNIQFKDGDQDFNCWADDYLPPKSYVSGTDVTLPALNNIYAISEDKVFEGWYEDSNFTTPKKISITSNDTGNKIFYAKWLDNLPITIKYLSQDERKGSIDKGYEQETLRAITGVAQGSVVSTNWGYKLSGWQHENGNMIRGGDPTFIPPKGESGYKTAVYTAVFEQDTYQISYDMNYDPTSPEYDDSGIDINDRGEMPTQTILFFTEESLTENGYLGPPGMVFAGWNTKPDGTGMAFEDRGLVENLPHKLYDMDLNLDHKNNHETLYAQWIPGEDVEISYQSSDPAMGTVSVSSETITPGYRAIGATAEPVTGYRFVNWTNAAGDIVSEEETLTLPMISGFYEADIYTANFVPNTAPATSTQPFMEPQMAGDVTPFATIHTLTFEVLEDENGNGMPQQSTTADPNVTLDPIVGVPTGEHVSLLPYLLSTQEKVNNTGIPGEWYFLAWSTYADVGSTITEITPTNRQGDIKLYGIWYFTPIYTMRILKKDPDGNPLQGAGFQLYRDEKCTIPATAFVDAGLTTNLENATDEQLKTDENGILDLFRVNVDIFNQELYGDSGKYWLKEVATPSGYSILAEPVPIVINPDCSITVSGQPVTPSDGVFTVEVTDNAIIMDLPVTGFGGVIPYIILGIVPMIGAVITLEIYSHRKKRQKN